MPGALTAFQDLLEETGEQSAVKMRRGHLGNGLYLTRSVIKGEVWSLVPADCISESQHLHDSHLCL